MVRRVVWCPRTIRNSFMRKAAAAAAALSSSNSTSSTSSSNSQRRRDAEIPDYISLNEAILRLTDIGLKCMSKIPDWNPKIGSLVTKFYENRVRYACSHNFIVYEESKLAQFKSVMKAVDGETKPPKEMKFDDIASSISTSMDDGSGLPRPSHNVPISAPGSRASTASTKQRSKNDPSKSLQPESAIFQFGKSSEQSEEYSLDFRFPLSPIQAFGIAISSFADEIVPAFAGADGIMTPMAKSRRPSASNESDSSGDKRKKKGKGKGISPPPPMPPTVEIGHIPLPPDNPPIVETGSKSSPPHPVQDKKQKRPSITQQIYSSLTSQGLSDPTPRGNSPDHVSTAGPTAATTVKPKKLSLAAQIFGSFSPAAPPTAITSAPPVTIAPVTAKPRKPSITSALFYPFVSHSKDKSDKQSEPPQPNTPISSGVASTPASSGTKRLAQFANMFISTPSADTRMGSVSQHTPVAQPYSNSTPIPVVSVSAPVNMTGDGKSIPLSKPEVVNEVSVLIPRPPEKAKNIPIQVQLDAEVEIEPEEAVVRIVQNNHNYAYRSTQISTYDIQKLNAKQGLVPQQNMPRVGSGQYILGNSPSNGTVAVVEGSMSRSGSNVSGSSVISVNTINSYNTMNSMQPSNSSALMSPHTPHSQSQSQPQYASSIPPMTAAYLEKRKLSAVASPMKPSLSTHAQSSGLGTQVQGLQRGESRGSSLENTNLSMGYLETDNPPGSSTIPDSVLNSPIALRRPVLTSSKEQTPEKPTQGMYKIPHSPAATHTYTVIHPPELTPPGTPHANRGPRIRTYSTGSNPAVLSRTSTLTNTIATPPPSNNTNIPM